MHNFFVDSASGCLLGLSYYRLYYYTLQPGGRQARSLETCWRKVRLLSEKSVTALLPSLPPCSHPSLSLVCRVSVLGINRAPTPSLHLLDHPPSHLPYCQSSKVDLPPKNLFSSSKGLGVFVSRSLGGLEAGSRHHPAPTGGRPPTAVPPSFPTRHDVTLPSSSPLESSSTRGKCSHTKYLDNTRFLCIPDLELRLMWNICRGRSDDVTLGREHEQSLPSGGR